MKRRSLILMILIVLLPVGLLTWLGSRIVSDEQLVTQQRFQSLMEQRLSDINRGLREHFEDTARRLQQITALDDFAPMSLREIVRNEPLVTQLFVMSPDGELLYPDPTDALNVTESSFLRQTSPMFSGQDLQTAVALAEAGVLEDSLVVGNSMPLPSRRSDKMPFDSPALAANSGVGGIQVAPDSDRMRFGSPPGALGSAATQAAVPQASSPLAADSVPDTRVTDVNATQTMADTDMPTAQPRIEQESAIDAVELPDAIASANQQVAKAIPQNDPAIDRGRGFGLGAGRMPTGQQRPAKQSPVQASVEPRVTSSGWFVWYWDRGLNLIYWQRRPSGHIVGALLERSRWIADVVSWLPETDPRQIQGSLPTLKTSFRVVNSAQETVYQWGGEVSKDAVSFCEAPLATPLDSWRLLCFVSNNELIAGTGRSARFILITGLVAFTLILSSLAWFLYRDYSRDMREANQQVSFVNQVSHELKTPLTNIRLYAELLEHDLEDVAVEQSEKPRRRLGIITSEAQRLSRLIGNVLTFASQQRRNLQLHAMPIRADELVQQIVERFTPSLNDHGIEVSMVSKEQRTLLIDPDFVEQIVGNLISNVEKYAAEGKRLVVQVTSTAADTFIDVIDEGPGIPVAYRSEVFQPFSRLSNDLRASTGTGIGLSIARDLARLHGGDLQLMDSPKGCWFQVRLRNQEKTDGT